MREHLLAGLYLFLLVSLFLHTIKKTFNLNRFLQTNQHPSQRGRSDELTR